MLTSQPEGKFVTGKYKQKVKFDPLYLAIWPRILILMEYVVHEIISKHDILFYPIQTLDVKIWKSKSWLSQNHTIGLVLVIEKITWPGRNGG